MNISNINTKKLVFLPVKKNNEIIYSKIKYDDSDLIFETNKLKYSHYYTGDSQYIVSFVTDNMSLITFLKSINSEIIQYCTSNKNILFDNQVNNTDIPNLFFSNIEENDNETIFKISCFDYDKIKSIISNKKTIQTIKVSGIWLINNMFGISYEYL